MVPDRDYLSRFVLFSFIIPLLLSCGGDSPFDPRDEGGQNGPISLQQKTLQFKGVRSIVRKPSQVQFFFSLRDIEGNALRIPPETLAQNTRIYENNTEIDYSETNFFISTAENFRMDVVLVLDFTRSMAAPTSTGETGIAQMLEGARTIIRKLGAAHRVALVEFHDRNVAPQIISYFTSDTDALLAILDDFAKRTIDNGSTRVWDAVITGLNLFPTEDNPDNVRLLVFLSDGFDTSSEKQPADIKSLAREKLAQIHCVGTGDAPRTEVLQDIAAATDGLYYAADDLGGITAQLEQIAINLSGQYKLSYISLTRNTMPSVRVEIEHEGEINAFQQELDLRAVIADDRIGELTYDDDVREGERANVFLRLLHTPRNINRFRFRFLATSKLDTVTLIAREEGGILDSTWQLFGPNPELWYTLKSDSSVLPFGGFGLLVNARFRNIGDSSLAVPFEMDNSIYSNEKRFSYPQTLYIGLPIIDPVPPQDSSNVPVDITLRWRVDNFRNQQNIRFDVRLDKNRPSERIVASDITSNRFKPATALEPNTVYYWQIIARSGRNFYSGPIWRFKTAP